MAATPEATQPAQPHRPGRADGVCSEFTVFTKIKPGHTDALREDLATLASGPALEAGRAALKEIGTLHDARNVIFDEGTRHMFASVFDGSWDTYIDDFARTAIAKNFEMIFSHAEGFPGIADPN
ncbi:MAG TPA: hypothetical protein VKP64_14960, partial [Mycobacteriales bacterium]|nr:hypothetical protein [Mycobacteriales bacterium]